MNQELWLKKRNELKAVSSEAVVAPTRYILVSCRPLEDAENKVLSKNFKNIIVYNAALNSGNLDLSKMTFDLLVIDVSQKENHLFLEIVSPMAVGLNTGTYYKAITRIYDIYNNFKFLASVV